MRRVWTDRASRRVQAPGEALAGANLHGLYAICADECIDGGVQADLDARPAVTALIEGGHLRANDAAEHAIRRFEHGDIESPLPGDRGNFQTDVTGADDEQARARRERLADRVHV